MGGFNSQPPKAAGSPILLLAAGGGVSTHSRPKAAGREFRGITTFYTFQLTAARRRLA